MKTISGRAERGRLPPFLGSKRLVLCPRPGSRFFRLSTAAERAPERDRLKEEPLELYPV